MKIYEFNNISYALKENIDDAFDYSEIKEYITPYFNGYDYIFGDVSYNKVRLKGFCNKKNKLYKKINDIDILEDYIKNYCAYGCKWFLLEKINK